MSDKSDPHEIRIRPLQRGSWVKKDTAYLKNFAAVSEKRFEKLESGQVKLEQGQIKLEQGQIKLLEMFFEHKDEMKSSMEELMESNRRILTLLDKLIIKDFQGLKQEDTMHIARLSRHDETLADHEERLQELEASTLS